MNIQAWLPRIIIIGAVIASIFFLVFSVIQVGFPYQLDYGEGPLLGQSVQLRTGETLLDIYSVSDTYPLRTANYSPLYFMVNALFVNPDAPSYISGRLLSVFSGFLAAIAVGWVVWLQTGQRGATIIAILIFLASPITARWSSLMRVDMMALALSLWAFAILLWCPKDNRVVIASMILIVLAAYTRQTYVLAVPLAGFIYLLQFSWQRAVTYIVGIGVLGLTFLLSLTMLTEGGFWFHTVDVYLRGNGTNSYGFYLNILSGATFLIGQGVLLLLIFSLRQKLLNYALITYTACSFIMVASTIKAGSNVNYLLELVAATSIMIGILWHWLNQQKPVKFRVGLYSVLLLQVIAFIIINVNHLFQHVLPIYDQLDEYHYLDQQIARVDGPVLADEEMGFLIQNGHLIMFQPFDYTQMVYQGLWEDTLVVDSITEQEFDLIIIHRAPDFIRDMRWTPAMLDAISAQYDVSDTLTCCILYLPR